jgi:hypothetical protein
MSPNDPALRPWTATELHRSQQLIRWLIADAVQRRDRGSLETISSVVYALEKELAEAYWELDWACRGLPHAPPRRFLIPLLRGLEGHLRSTSCCFRPQGVAFARWAARIRGRLRPGFPHLDSLPENCPHLRRSGRPDWISLTFDGESSGSQVHPVASLPSVNAGRSEAASFLRTRQQGINRCRAFRSLSPVSSWCSWA